MRIHNKHETFDPEPLNFYFIHDLLYRRTIALKKLSNFVDIFSWIEKILSIQNFRLDFRV